MARNYGRILPTDIICSLKLTDFLELHSRKTARFSEQMMSGDKYPSIFPRPMETIVYIVFICRLLCFVSVMMCYAAWQGIFPVLPFLYNKPYRDLCPLSVSCFHLSIVQTADNWSLPRFALKVRDIDSQFYLF